MYVSQVVTLYTLNLYRALSSLYLNKAGRKRSKIKVCYLSEGLRLAHKEQQDLNKQARTTRDSMVQQSKSGVQRREKLLTTRRAVGKRCGRISPVC